VLEAQCRFWWKEGSCTVRGIVGNVGLVNSIGHRCECLLTLLLLMHAIWLLGSWCREWQRLETKENDEEDMESRYALCGMF